MKELEFLITTPDGEIKIYYDKDEGRRTITYTDLSGNTNHLGTLKDGEYLWMDGT